MPRPGDQHAVSAPGPCGAYRPFRIGVPRAARQDIHHLDPGPGQHSVERISELPGPVPDEEPEAVGPLIPGAC